MLAKDHDIGALVQLLFKDWDLNPLPPKSPADFREAAAALKRQIFARAHRREVPCAEDRLELARIYFAARR